MIYFYYFILLPILYVLGNIFYFIYKFKFFSWRRFHAWYISDWEFSSYYLTKNKSTLKEAGDESILHVFNFQQRNCIKRGF